MLNKQKGNMYGFVSHTWLWESDSWDENKGVIDNLFYDDDCYKIVMLCKTGEKNGRKKINVNT